MKALIRRGDRPLLLGVVHLPPLPGAPRYEGEIAKVFEHARRDAESLLTGGADGFILENFGDAPFYPHRAPPETVAAISALGYDLRQTYSDCLLGVNVLRNDALAAIAIAATIEADFIRVNILSGARLTDQGLIEGESHQLLRDRRRLLAERIRIMADVDVKHSAPLAEQTLAQQTEDLLQRGGADALIVSGAGTGKAAAADQLQGVREAAGDAAVFVGSGASIDNIQTHASLCDGFIVGTSLKENGNVRAPVDPERVRAFRKCLIQQSKAKS